MDLGEIFLMACEAYSPLSVEYQLPGYFLTFALKEPAVTGGAGAIGMEAYARVEAGPAQWCTAAMLLDLHDMSRCVHELHAPALTPVAAAGRTIAGAAQLYACLVQYGL